MCSFGSYQTRFEFLSQFRKVRNAFECFVTQVQTGLPKTKCVWPMKINVICTVSDHLLTTVLKLCGECDRVDVVFAIYKQLSIKDAERSLRASKSSPGIRFTNIVPGHKIKQWRRLLSCGESKKQLISFIANQWKHPVQRQQLNNKVLYVTCGEVCTKITFLCVY